MNDEFGIKRLKACIADLERQLAEAVAREMGYREVLQAWMDTLIVLDNQPKRTDLIELKMQTHRLLSLAPSQGEDR